MNHYPHHISDFNNATRHLTRIERSIYSDMIDMYYDTEQPLTLDLPYLKRKLMAHSQDEKNAVDDVLSEFFIKTESGYFNTRCNEELVRYLANKSLKAEAGKASAAKREQDKAAKLAELNKDKENNQHNSTDVEQVLNHVATESNCIPTNENENENENDIRAEKHVNEDVHASVSKPEKYKDEIQNVFEHWKKVMQKRGTVILDSKRKSAIRARLADGYTQDMLCKAIDGCSMTDHNMGRTVTNKTLYNDITLICRDAEHVDRFMANAGETQTHQVQEGETFIYEPPKPLNDREGCVSKEDAKRFAREALRQMGAGKQ